MKKFIVLALVLGASSNAFATSTIRTLAQCNTNMVDAGVSVTVSSYTGPGTIGKPADISAEVDQFFLMRNQKFNFYGLTEKTPNPQLLGSGYSFEGKDFSLEICTDCAPLPNGKIHGTLTYEANGARQVEQVSCTLNR